MGGIVSGVTGAVGGILGGIGAHKAAKEQVKSNDKQQALQRDQLAYQQQQMAPFVNAGQDALKQLTGLAGQPIDRASTLSDYYKSPEYQMMADQARYNILNSAEATGGLGASATGNALGGIAAQLGQNYLSQMTAQQQDMYNQLMGLTNVGLSGAGANVSSSQQFASQQSNLLGQQGQIKAGKAALPWQVAGGVNNSLGNGVAQDMNTGASMFGNAFGALF